jgi:outer membrane protein
MKCFVFLSLMILATSPAARAQAPVTLTLEEAIIRGIEASHRLGEIGARREAAQAVEDQRKAASMPLVSLQAGYTRTNHVDEFGIPGGRLIYPDIPDNVRSRLDLQWPIYTGGRTSALTRAAAAEADALGLDRDTARADLKLEITRAYWAVVTARASVDVVTAALARIGAHLTDVRNQLAVGLVPPSDVLTLEAQQAHQQQLLIEAQNLVETSSVDFRRLVGLAPEAPFELADRIDTPAARSQQVAALVDSAKANRAERKALEIRLGGATERKTAAEAGRLPLIATAGGYDFARPNPRIFPRQAEWRTSWDVGVNLSWALFDGGRVRAEVAEAAANRRAAEERLKDFDVTVDAEVRQRAADLASAEAAIASAEIGIRSAEEARRVVADRFSAGVATNTDVIDAQLALLQAGLDRTRALANAHLAAARLDRAIGQ